MFYDYRSLSRPQLLDTFLKLLRQKRPVNPFQEQWIIVQNREMQQWLTFNEAKSYSISANKEFIFPSEFLWKLYRLKNPELDTVLVSDLMPIQWSVFAILSSNQALLAEIVCKKEVPDELLYELSKSIADVFDLYQVFRPDMIKAWQFGQLKYNTSEEKWQAKLWNILVQEWKKETAQVSRVQAFTELKGFLTSGEFPFHKLPEELWLFGLPQMPEPFSEIISLLAMQKDIYNFGYEIPKETEEHPFGKKLLQPLIQSSYILKQSLDKYGVKSKNELLDAPKFKNTTLGIVQKFLWYGGNVSFPNSEPDSTLSVNSCHSKKREVEVAKDAILNALEENNDLLPEDILILVPDMDNYQDLIYNSFSSKPEVPVSLGFEDHEEFINSTLVAIINVLSSGFKVNEVLDLIDNMMISAKWGFSNEEVQRLRKWASELHIHRFMDGDVFSWLEGLDKLFMGYAMEAKDSELVMETFPFYGISTIGSVELVGKISLFINELAKYAIIFSGKRTLTEWIGKLQIVAKKFIVVGSDDEFRSAELLKTLDYLKRSVQKSILKDEVGFDIFSNWVKEYLSRSASSFSRAGHGITIGEYVPNRSVPYKFVAVLGLNEKELPRSINRPAFDLIYKNPEPGDRITLDEDRNTFFDLFQAAGEYLHISYIGQDLYSVNKKNPSVLLQQLTDLLSESGIAISAKEHKMHGFDPFYFSDAETKSYSRLHFYLASNAANEFTETKQFVTENVGFSPEDANKEINIQDLIRFFSHPAKHLANNIFGINYYEEHQELEDRELFRISGLEEYHLKSFLTDSFFSDLDLTDIKKPVEKKGLIPLGYPGEMAFDQAKKTVEQFEDIRNQFNWQKIEKVQFESVLNKSTLYGTISNIFNGCERVVIRLGELRGKDIIELWINHLALSMCSDDVRSTLPYLEKKKTIKSIELKEIKDAKELLARLVFNYQESMRSPGSLLLPIETSYVFARFLVDGKEVENAEAEAFKKWDGGERARFSECMDPYNNLFINGSDFIQSKKFQKNAIELWRPVLEALRGSK